MQKKTPRDADLLTIQDLLGHTRIKTTQRCWKVSNLKVQRDYNKAMEKVLQRTDEATRHWRAQADSDEVNMDPFSAPWAGRTH